VRILIEIDCDGAAFTGADGKPTAVGAALQTADILQYVARRMMAEGSIEPRSLTDSNGNRCGTLRVEG
jgi:hypothetical protein